MAKRWIAMAVGAAALLAPAGASAQDDGSVWICRPGLADNPCKAGLDATRFSPGGEQLGVDEVKAKRPRVDCFYLYPTVSDDEGENSDLSVDPELRSIALYQAARYSEHCRVYAPVYRQVTLGTLLAGGGFTEAGLATSVASATKAFKTYLRKYNRGRGIVFIGHSQGTYVLRELIAARVDPKRKLRKRTVSALLFGGGLSVDTRTGKSADFRHLNPCRRAKQLRCTVGFSAFNEPVPPNSIFGRTTVGSEEVQCTNPAAPKTGGPAALDTIYPVEPFAPETTIGFAIAAMGLPRPPAETPWYRFQGAYSGRCSSADGANVLQLADAPGAPHLNAVPSPEWGLHLADANLALGNQVRLVGRQARKYAKRAERRRP